MTKVIRNAEDAYRWGASDYEVLWSLGAAHIFDRNYSDGLGAYDEALTYAQFELGNFSKAVRRQLRLGHHLAAMLRFGGLVCW